jgi:BlaI family transcriptional regulator, penicillinase repressor
MSKKPIELTEAEWRIIKAVWAGEPCTAPGIQSVLEGETGWTYSTVRTLMDRMVVKGLLAAKKLGKMTTYRAVATPRQAQRGELMYALKNAFNGALTPMVECLLNTRDLTSDELHKIELLIQTKKRDVNKTPGRG